MTIRNIWFLIFYGVLILSSIFFLRKNFGKFPKFFNKIDILNVEEINIAGVKLTLTKKIEAESESGIKHKDG